ncbi:5135_t:CDS:2, partial [Dentiscutata heterogama]
EDDDSGYKCQVIANNASDLDYSQLIDNVGDGISGEDVSLALLNTMHNLENTIDFIFSVDILNNLVIYLEWAIFSSLNLKVNLINNTVLQ